VATLFATEATRASGESFGNMPVANRRPLQGDPVRGKVTLHATIREHRGNGAFSASNSPLHSVQGDEGDQDVTINCTPIRINNDTTVSIAIKRNAQVSTVRAHLLAECGRISRTNAIVDHAVSHRKRHHRCASRGERCDGEWRGGTVCRVNHHAQGAGAHGTGKLRQCSRISITKRLSFQRVRVRWRNHLQACCQSAFHGRLKLSFLRVRNLSPVTCEHLQAVVLRGIM
jgi:hypothetical protein